MNSFSEKVLKYGSFLLVFLAPIVFLSYRLYPHISTKTFFIYGATELLFFVWVYLLITDRHYRLRKKTLIYFLPPAVFVLWMSIAGVSGVNPELSFWSSFGRGTGLLTLYHSLVLSFIVASLVKKHGSSYVVSLLQWFFAGAFFLAVSIWLGTEGFKFATRALEKDAGGGFAGNSTLAAGYLLFSLAVAGFLLSVKNISATQKRMIGVATLVIVFSPVLFSLYRLFSGAGIIGTARGTILALASGLCASGIAYLFLSHKKSFKLSGIALAILSLITFGLLWVNLMNPSSILHQKFIEQARESRFIFWDIAEKAMNERPIFGYGPENYASAYQRYFNPNILVEANSFEGWNDRAHNIFYELGSTAGYPAILLYFIFLVSLFCAVYRIYHQGQINRIQASLFGGLLVAYMVNNLFTFDSILSLLSLFVLVGILYAPKQDESEKKLPPVMMSESNKNIIAFVLALFCVFSWIFFVHMPSVKSRAYMEAFSSPVNKRGELYPKLLKGSSIGSHWDISQLAFDTYRLYALNVVALKKDKEKLPHLIKNLEALIAHLYKVSENNHTDYRLYITISFLESTLTYLSDRPNTNETKERILAVLEKTRSLSPTNPNVYWSIAQVKVWAGDFDGAEEAYREAIRVAPSLRASYNLALNYADIVGNKKLFNEFMAQAKENISDYEFKN